MFLHLLNSIPSLNSIPLRRHPWVSTHLLNFALVEGKLMISPLRGYSMFANPLMFLHQFFPTTGALKRDFPSLPSIENSPTTGVPKHELPVPSNTPRPPCVEGIPLRRTAVEGCLPRRSVEVQLSRRPVEGRLLRLLVEGWLSRHIVDEHMFILLRVLKIYWQPPPAHCSTFRTTLQRMTTGDNFIPQCNSVASRATCQRASPMCLFEVCRGCRTL